MSHYLVRGVGARVALIWCALLFAGAACSSPSSGKAETVYGSNLGENQACGDSSQCAGDLRCYAGYCRNFGAADAGGTDATGGKNAEQACIDTHCASEEQACWNDAGCTAYNACLGKCSSAADTACIKKCNAQSPSAALQLYSSVWTCAQTNGCFAGGCAGDACADTADADVGGGGCGTITVPGCCDGSLNKYCNQNGILAENACGSQPCGWNPKSGWYECGYSGEDPSGVNPIACPTSCVPQCAGKSGGPDQCGGTCPLLKAMDCTAHVWPAQGIEVGGPIGSIQLTGPDLAQPLTLQAISWGGLTVVALPYMGENSRLLELRRDGNIIRKIQYETPSVSGQVGSVTLQWLDDFDAATWAASNGPAGALHAKADALKAQWVSSMKSAVKSAQNGATPIATLPDGTTLNLDAESLAVLDKVLMGAQRSTALNVCLPAGNGQGGLGNGGVKTSAAMLGLATGVLLAPAVGPVVAGVAGVASVCGWSAALTSVGKAVSVIMDQAAKEFGLEEATSDHVDSEPAVVSKFNSVLTTTEAQQEAQGDAPTSTSPQLAADVADTYAASQPQPGPCDAPDAICCFGSGSPDVCSAGQSCNSLGFCAAVCFPKCDGKCNYEDDTCNGKCQCGSDQQCSAGVCEDKPCKPDCAQKCGGEADPNGCNDGTCPDPCAGKGCAAGVCQAACATGLTNCSGACTDVNSDLAHCGVDCLPCDVNEDCVAGICVPACNANQCSTTPCKNDCGDNMDGCNTACETGKCANGACVPPPSCDPNKCAAAKPCVDDCGGTNDSCGGCPSGTCQNGLCVTNNCSVGVCNPNFPCHDLCGNELAKCAAYCQNIGDVCNAGNCETPNTCAKAMCGGQCVDTDTDGSNCGACGKVCAGGETCSSGVCSGGSTCGYTECSGQCVNTETDENNCGSCGKKCGSGQTCTNGVCDCPGSDEFCGGACVDTGSDEGNCGQCGKKCASGQTCSSGVCECPNSESLCNGTCVDTQSNESNCGGCGKSCPSAQSCVNGVCDCPGSEQLCSGQCVDLNSDESHCGSCGKSCTGGQQCLGGTCDCPNANEDFCNGQCVDIVSNEAHCGNCYMSCTGSETCQNKVCQ